MRLPRRLIGRFILSAVLIGAVVGAVGLHATVKLEQSAGVATDIGKRLLPTVDLIGEMRATMTRVRLGATRVLDDTEAKAIARARERNQSRIAEMQLFIDRYDQLTKDTGDGPAFEAFRSQWRAYIAQQSAALDLSGSDAGAARALFNGPANQLYDTAWKSLDAMKAAGSRAAQEAADRVATERTTSFWTTLGGTALGVTVALLLMGWLARDVARNAVRVAAAMKRLAAGETDTDVPCTGRTDEIGDIAVAALGFRENLIHSRQLETETALAQASVEEQRKAGMRQMADSFEAAVGGIVSTVSSSATELQATSQTMTATATQTASQSTSVAAAAEEAAANVGTVAAAARQLGASVQEIGRQVAGSASLAQAAVSEADQTARLVQTLSQAVSKIGDVAGLISSIAEQTNLLALNATIEAARAGQAGRGFAVVAAEVKELAGQTARATEEITGHIHRIQDSTGHAVSAIGGIAGRIREINAVAATIAAAVEEQGSATQEIVRSVAQAAAGTGEVVTNIAGVAGAVQDTGAAACQVLDAASELSRQSEFLTHEVTRFLQTVRAA